MTMAGKTCLVTGATSGTGYVTALALARAGATVAMLCRDAGRAERARAAIAAASGNPRVEVLLADLGEMAEVDRAADAFLAGHDRLDVLVNNAGGLVTPRRETGQGLEAMFAGNYLGHFLLTLRLLDRLKTSAPARIVNVSSVAHVGARIDFDDLQSRRRFSAFRVYGETKLAQILFTYALAERLAGTAMVVNAMHPGAVASGFKNGVTGWKRALAGAVYGLVGISPEQGADTIVWLATAPEAGELTGRYVVKRRAVPSRGQSNDPAVRERLWERSVALLRELGTRLPA